MATKIVMPKLSPTMEEGQLARWLKKEGEQIAPGETIAEVDTDKATMEVTANTAGVLRKILVHEGESVPLGHPIAIVGEADEDISALLTEVEKSPGGEKVKQSAPAAEERAAREERREAPSPEAPSNGERGAERIFVSPIAARMAAEAGINLRTLKGSGPGGRIIKRDIEAAIEASRQAAPRLAEAAPAQPIPSEAAPYEEVPLTEMRRTIARRLASSIGPVPHFFLTTEIEMDRAIELRRSLNELDPELNISLNDIIVKVAAAALMQHPQVNASFQERAIRYYKQADIGVAVALEDGLITPVVRAANLKSLGTISREIRELAERARARKLKPEEYTGATFSVSNLGMFGIDEFTAIINPPEAGILAVGAAQPKPVVRDGEIVIRQMMRVTMSCDHRIIDGATGAQFLQTFKRLLENPLRLLI
ncbi:pyruvate dehydrogenase complex dihydrolipoamide acetyltransferase [Pyrinomonas methylaliphatogenes]|uniref:Acetyltransferase component of pyruvate dehydrogenase complex n=1 Tax=Pyrinomonas methylaliphatogenes TaxID=454194 RepID=A0A0B6WW64_9BACT|nr:pyruvate dehydrogenase complex dihydrolipoamide acetyltransferase [Pyrinomonas methylaliphatogenes]CDM64987.1 pyruvate dehydrogenase complex dihydrolipoamide acetyltransferase, long form [Pyrinomonas methylaliphatogenes]